MCEVRLVLFEEVCVFITNRCNLTCDYCYRINSTNDFMTQEVFERVLSKLIDFDVKQINITGGESLLHPKWREYIKCAHEMNFQVILSTNGLLLNLDDPILNYIDVLAIGLDGSCEEIDSKFRGMNHFSIVNDIIQKYKKKKYNFSLKINTVLTKENYDDIENMIPIVLGDNIFWRVFFCKFKGDYNSLSNDKAVSRDDYLNKVKALNKLMPEAFMLKSCLEDSTLDRVYTLINADGMLFVSRGEKDFLIGDYVSLSVNELISKINNTDFSIKKH